MNSLLFLSHFNSSSTLLNLPSLPPPSYQSVPSSSPPSVSDLLFLPRSSRCMWLMRVHCFDSAGVNRGMLTVIVPSSPPPPRSLDVLSLLSLVFCVAYSGLQADPSLQRDPAVLGGTDGDRPAAHLLPAGKHKQRVSGVGCLSVNSKLSSCTFLSNRN